jgi:hypothetical protein
LAKAGQRQIRNDRISLVKFIATDFLLITSTKIRILFLTAKSQGDNLGGIGLFFICKRFDFLSSLIFQPPD